MQKEVLNEECIFCKIAKKEEKSYIIWESTTHLAFLSIFPNMKGVTVVIPKKHFDSYAFEMPDSELQSLINAAKQVAINILDKKLKGVGRTALVLEGFGVNHVHVKLYPLHGTDQTNIKWKPIKSNYRKYFQTYEGYISSNDGEQASELDLLNLQKILIE